MKITKAIIKQKDQDYWLKYWTELEPSRFDYNTVGGTLPPMHVQDLSKRVELWQKSFKEVRIHPTQKQAFGWLARSIYDSWPDSHPMDYANYLKTPGVDLPPESIYLDSEVNSSIVYAFLVEGKKETPEIPADELTDHQLQTEAFKSENKLIRRGVNTGTKYVFGFISGSKWMREKCQEPLFNTKESSKGQKELWISVEERLPEQNVLVLVSRLYGGGNRDFRLTYINHHGEFDDFLNDRITHWIPLPEPPKTK